MTRFEDFKQNCLINGGVTCGWGVLHGYLIDKTVADNWWVLTREERVSICDACCNHFGSRITDKKGLDTDGDGLPDVEAVNTFCKMQSSTRYLILNLKEYRESEYYGNFANCYYYIRRDGWHHSEEEGYELPCHVVRGVVGGAGLHGFNAIQIGEDVTKIYNWYIFDMDLCNIKPDHPLFSHYLKGRDICILLADRFLTQVEDPPYSWICLTRFRMDEGHYDCIAHFTDIKPEDWNEEEYHNTILSISIINADGNVITEADVGETIYVYGTLEDAETSDYIEGAEISLYKNGTYTGLKYITDELCTYLFPYTVVEEYKPSVLFKTKFEGGEV